MDNKEQVEQKLVPVQVTIEIPKRSASSPTVPGDVYGYTYEYVLAGWVAGQVKRFPLLRRNEDESVDADWFTDYYSEDAIIAVRSSHTESGIERTAMEPEMESLINMIGQIGQSGPPTLPVEEVDSASTG